MKNKFLLISILIISFSAIFLFSCKKVINKPDETGTYSGLRTYSGLADAMSDITFADSVLVFVDTDNFVATYQFLDSLYEDYNDKFEYAHRTLTDSALDYLADSLRFDEQAPFAWFESSFTGFHSLRKHVNGEIEKWLAHDSLDFRNDPDDIEIQGNVLRTLVNQKGYVKIGTAMYNMNNGRVEDTTGCHGWKRLHKEYNYGAGMHKFKNTVVLRDYAFFSVVYGSVVNFKKKNSIKINPMAI